MLGSAHRRYDLGLRLLLVGGRSGDCRGAGAPAINQADTAWMLISTALVLLMTPALAFFYGGLVRSKNALNTMMMSFISLGFVGVLWAVIGYSLALRHRQQLDRRHCRWSSCAASASSRRRRRRHDPAPALHVLPGHVRIITAALISGAIVERMRFSAYVVFITLWALLVYSPIAHWVWGGGWLADMGALDFAGGTVVHVNAGVAALVAAIVRRQAARTTRRRRCCRTTCRSRCSAPACSGSAGSASTPAARWRPARIAGLAFVDHDAGAGRHAGGLDVPRRRPSAASRPPSAPPRDRRRPGRGHAGGRLHRPDERDRPRRDRRRPELLRRCSGAPRRRSTTRSTSSPRTASAARSARC